MRIRRDPHDPTARGRRERRGRRGRGEPTRRPGARTFTIVMAGGVLALALLVALALLRGSGSHPATSASLARDHRGTRLRTDPGAVAASRAARPRLLATQRPTGRPVRVSIAAGPVGPAAPADFLGLSFELRSLPLLAHYASASGPASPSGRAGFGDLLSLMRSLGPGVLRFGGASADEQVAWVAGSANGERQLPRWASTGITAADLTGIATLARASGWRVLLTVNLGHYDPTAAAQEAAAAHAALGAALIGIELGNEPDMYVAHRLRPRGWDRASAGTRRTPARPAVAPYGAQAAADRAAIEAAAPGVPIAGPDAATGIPGLAWVRFAARTLHPALLTDHYYPLSNCGYRPTVDELLSPNVRRAEREMLAKLAAIAHAAATPLRIDETNSISCEGRPGVSDAFASALWTLDYTAHAIAAGVTGLNFHDLLTKPGAYSPLLAPNAAALAAGSLHAQPEWYALLAARELPGSRPLPVRVTDVNGRSSIGAQLSASAFRAPDGSLRLVLVDYDPSGSRPLAVHLQLAPEAGAVTAEEASAAGDHARTANRTANASLYTSGSVLRLTGPSPSATAGVRLGGRAVATDGSWSPPAALPALYTRAGAHSLQLAPSSAAVVTLYPR